MIDRGGNSEATPCNGGVAIPVSARMRVEGFQFETITGEDGRRFLYLGHVDSKTGQNGHPKFLIWNMTIGFVTNIMEQKLMHF